MGFLLASTIAFLFTITPGILAYSFHKKCHLFFSLKNKPLRTARAWALKESLRELWSYHSRGWAEKALLLLVCLGYKVLAGTGKAGSPHVPQISAQHSDLLET